MLCVKMITSTEETESIRILCYDDTNTLVIITQEVEQESWRGEVIGVVDRSNKHRTHRIESLLL